MFGYLQSLLHLPRAVHFYLLSEGLFGIGVGMALIFNFHYLALGFDTTVIGIATACNSISIAACSYFAGMVTDRRGAKFAMLLGCAIVVIGYTLIGLVTTPLGLYLAQCVLGCGTSFIIACEFPYIMSLCERREDETTAYNMLVAAFTLTLSLGQILGTHLPTVLPRGTTMYQSTVFLVAMSFFLMGVLRCFLPAKSERVAEEQQNKPQQRGWRVVPSRQVVLFVLYAAIAGGVASLLSPFENIIMRERFAMPDESIGYLLAVNSFFLFLVSMFAPFVMQLRGRRVVMFASFGVQLVLFLGMGNPIPAVVFGLLFLGKGSAGMMINSVVDSSMMKATLEEERGLHAGLRNLLRSAVGSLASGLGGLMLASGNYLSIYFVTFAAVAVQLLVYALFVRKQLTKDLEESF